MMGGGAAATVAGMTAAAAMSAEMTAGMGGGMSGSGAAEMSSAGMRSAGSSGGAAAAGAGSLTGPVARWVLAPCSSLAGKHVEGRWVQALARHKGAQTTDGYLSQGRVLVARLPEGLGRGGV